jgi:hypothetical protein
MPTPKRSISSRVAKQNPRPRKYATAAERQKALRERFPTLCVRVEQEQADFMKRIADEQGRTLQDVHLAFIKYANGRGNQWLTQGLKGFAPLPRFEEPPKENPMKTEILERAKLPDGTRVRLQKRGNAYDVITNSTGITWRYLEKAVSEERARNAFNLYTMQRKKNPIKTTQAKRKPTPAQLAARERFAAMARSGAFKKKAKRNPAKVKRNPISDIANIIYNQLGANRFAMMTGAKNFVAGDNFLMFSIGKNQSVYNKVRITLTPDDLYDLEFFKMNRLGDISKTQKFEGVYAEQLQDLFTQVTGLYTSMGTMGRRSNPRASNPIATKRKANPVKPKVPKYTVQTLTSGKANWKRVAMFDSLEQAKAYAEAVPRAYKVVAVRVIDDK